MAAVHVGDVAKYILEQQGEMTAMKLQKLCYYSQAWSLVWDEEPLFDEEIQAWANGPVIPALYEQHRGMWEVRSSDIQGDSSWETRLNSAGDYGRHTVSKCVGTAASRPSIRI